MADKLTKSNLTQTKTVTFSLCNNEFDGRQFYAKYKDALFLKCDKNVRLILANYYEIKWKYDKVQPDQEFLIDEIYMEPGIPLILKKSKFADESDIGPNDFTLRRLTGFLAAFVYNHPKEFPCIYCEESECLNLQKLAVYMPQYDSYLKQYLSAVSGAEYFLEEFSFYPFIFALRKYELKRISEELLQDIANIRCPVTQTPLIAECKTQLRNFSKSALGSSFINALQIAPQNIKHFFSKNLPLEPVRVPSMKAIEF